MWRRLLVRRRLIVLEAEVVEVVVLKMPTAENANLYCESKDFVLV